MCTQTTTTEYLALSVTPPECPGTFGGKRRLRLYAGFSAFSLDYALWVAGLDGIVGPFFILVLILNVVLRALSWDWMSLLKYDFSGCGIFFLQTNLLWLKDVTN